MFMDPDDFQDDDAFYEYDGYEYDLFDDDDEDDFDDFYDTPLHNEGLEDV